MAATAKTLILGVVSDLDCIVAMILPSLIENLQAVQTRHSHPTFGILCGVEQRRSWVK
jgi:hypothetical protein